MFECYHLQSIKLNLKIPTYISCGVGRSRNRINIISKWFVNHFSLSRDHGLQIFETSGILIKIKRDKIRKFRVIIRNLYVII